MTLWHISIKENNSINRRVNNNTFNVALTSDIWSGRAKEDYLSIVIVDTLHSSIVICKHILNVLIDFDLTNRVIAVTRGRE